MSKQPYVTPSQKMPNETIRQAEKADISKAENFKRMRRAEHREAIENLTYGVMERIGELSELGFKVTITVEPPETARRLFAVDIRLPIPASDGTIGLGDFGDGLAGCVEWLESHMEARGFLAVMPDGTSRPFVAGMVAHE